MNPDAILIGLIVIPSFVIGFLTSTWLHAKRELRELKEIRNFAKNSYNSQNRDKVKG
jgi:hypothetical protein